MSERHGAPSWRPGGLVVVAVVLSAGAVIVGVRVLPELVEALSTYTWSTAVAERSEASYLLHSSGSPIEVKRIYYDVNVGSQLLRELDELFTYARNGDVRKERPLYVRLNPRDPERSIIVPGIPPQTAYGVVLWMMFLVPAVSAWRAFAFPKASRELPIVCLASYVACFCLLTLLAKVLRDEYRTALPSWLMLVFALVSGLFFLRFERWRKLYRKTGVRRAVFLLVYESMGLLLTIVVGLLFVPMLSVFVAGVAFVVLLRTFSRNQESSEEGGLLSHWLLLLWIPPYFAGLAAPCLALTLLVHEYWNAFPHGWPLSRLGPEIVAWLGIFAGYCGVGVGLYAALLVGFWKLQQARQLANLPTSKARSAAVGLSEFRGVARPCEDDPDDPILQFRSSKLRSVPFYLKDGTGRILVDPRGAEFRPRQIGSGIPLVSQRVCEIVLTRRVGSQSVESWWRGETMAAELRAGDRVYVIGCVQPREDAPSGARDSEALVVRPLKEPKATTSLW